jgi:hypothetical protein
MLSRIRPLLWNLWALCGRLPCAEELAAPSPQSQRLAPGAYRLIWDRCHGLPGS